MSKINKKKGFLSKVRLAGTAGVDHPAHEHEGWAVIKSAASNLEKEVSMDPEVKEFFTTLLETAERYSDQHTALVKALSDAEEYLEEAPENVQASAVTIFKFLHAIETAEETADEPVAKSEETPADEGERPGLMAKIATFLAKGRQPAPAPVVDEAPAEAEVAKAEDTPPVVAETEEIDWNEFLQDVQTSIAKQLREEDSTDGAN